MNEEEKKIDSTDENINVDKTQIESSAETFPEYGKTNNREVEKNENNLKENMADEEKKADSNKKDMADDEKIKKKSKDAEFSLNWHLKVLTIIYAVLFIFYIILKLFLK